VLCAGGGVISASVFFRGGAAVSNLADKDKKLITRFLWGLIPQDSEEGRRAQEALWRYLVDCFSAGCEELTIPIPRFVLGGLTTFFEPRPSRKEITKMKRANVAQYIYLYKKRHGAKAEAAFVAAMKLFDLSRAAVTSAWREFGGFAARPMTSKDIREAWEHYDDLAWEAEYRTPKKRRTFKHPTRPRHSKIIKLAWKR
jgi:hypothetical protein